MPSRGGRVEEASGREEVAEVREVVRVVRRVGREVSSAITVVSCGGEMGEGGIVFELQNSRFEIFAARDRQTFGVVPVAVSSRKVCPE